MRTRDNIPEDHDHYDQQNFDPYTPGGAVLRSLLSPAPQYADRAQVVRDKWAPRNVDTRTIKTSRTGEEPL